MDDIVRQAMVKWPDVPDCYGWLGLDKRGQWWMRDDRVQALGAFQSGQPGAKGSLLQHEKLINFIQRNYEADATGCWYFQNGPQKVYVELEATPHIWRIENDFSMVDLSGVLAEVNKMLVDENGLVYLDTTRGFGLVHTLDVATAAQALEMEHWTLEEAVAEELPSRYAYEVSPINAKTKSKQL
jgi:hypothetical protein